jgi:hypothetical protein
MPPKKYMEFAESVPKIKIAKKNAESAVDMRSYVGLTCPHCLDEFVEIPVDCMESNKASACNNHLRKCEAAKQAGAGAPPPKRRVAHVGVHSSDDQNTESRTAIVSQNAELKVENVQLGVVVDSLNGKIDELTTTMKRMEARIDDLEKFQASIVDSLEIFTPPPPSTKECVRGIRKLKETNVVVVSENERLRKQRNKAREERDTANAEKEDANVARKAFDSLARHKKFEKAMRTVTCPDGAQNIYTNPQHLAAAADLFQALLNANQRF